MRFIGWRYLTAMILALGLILGCTGPPSAAAPPLSAAAAQQTLDSWNPSHCKVVEFYGFYQPQGKGSEQVAYVLLANPGDKAPKPLVFAARFLLLTQTDGRQSWFLTSLISHGAGLTRRQGWDNLIIPVGDGQAAAR